MNEFNLRSCETKLTEESLALPEPVLGHLTDGSKMKGSPQRRSEALKNEGRDGPQWVDCHGVVTSHKGGFPMKIMVINLDDWQVAFWTNR